MNFFLLILKVSFHVAPDFIQEDSRVTKIFLKKIFEYSLKKKCHLLTLALTPISMPIQSDTITKE